MKPIKVPKTPASAYDDTRPASDLLRAHVQNLEKAVHGPKKRTAVTPSLTEAQASRYIRELGRRLHHKHLLPEIAPAPTIGQRPRDAASRPTRRLARRPSGVATRRVKSASRSPRRKVR